MLCLEIHHNGQPIARAGTEDWAVMSAHVSAVRGDGGNDPGELDLHIGGLSRPDESGVSHHTRWPVPELEQGDEVTIRILDCADPDPPRKRFRSDREVQEYPYSEDEMREMRYRDYLALKAEFEGSPDAPA